MKVVRGRWPGRWPPIDADRSTPELADAAARVMRRLHAGAVTDVGGTVDLPSDEDEKDKMTARVRLALERRSRAAMIRSRVARAGALAAAIAVASTTALMLGRRGNLGGATGVGRTGALVVLNAAAADGTVPDSLHAAHSVEGGQPRPLALGMTLATGTRVSAPATGEITMGTSDGTSLALEAGGALTIVEQSATRRFSLMAGAVRARVAKLAPRERFVITTDDAEIEVHGTAFRVAMASSEPGCGDGTRTRVSVVEGVVSVRSRGEATRVPAGGAWPAGCAPPEARESAILAPARAVERAAERAADPAVERATENVRPGRSRAQGTVGATSFAAGQGRNSEGSTSTRAEGPRATTTTTTAGSGLGVQNDLLVAAIQARRQERPREAERLLTELIEHYPSGPLLETATAQRMRLLASVDRRAATLAATAYLARFPDGFARDEARRLTGIAP